MRVGQHLDARDDALGRRELVAPDREAVDDELVALLRQLAEFDGDGALEELGVVNLEDRELGVVAHELDLGRILAGVAGFLNLDEGRIGHHVGVGQDASALDDGARASGVLLVGQLPRLEVVGLLDDGEELDQRLADGVLGGGWTAEAEDECGE
ncbi:MAG: hypothetical protein HY077_01595 [Elusimicrobia bacterium]|nr:hypothetical protein [Elusimicrobiota bacterium]